MKIIVLVKQVPDTTEIVVDKVSGTLIRAGVPTIINPDDLAGIEEALRIKETTGAHITVITMGPPQAEEMLRECFARGVDAGVLVCDSKFAGADTWATSNTLAAAIRLFDYDLIIAGRQAIDGDTAQVGPQVAEKLNIPQITLVEQIKSISKEQILVQRASEDASELVSTSLPCLITTLSTMNNARDMNCEDVWRAYDRDITRLGFGDLGIALDQVGLLASPTSVKRSFTKEVSAATQMYTLSAKETATSIAHILKDKKLVSL